jgi:ATP-dependent helicase/nuclease subunit A
MSRATTTVASKPDSLVATERAQLAASDPAASVWVAANAGAGKTHVLKMRVLRLLLAGAKPERILCLTFTKAAAAEMSSRVFADLAGWTVADEASLSTSLQALLGRRPGDNERLIARRLFAEAIETPGGLKVQTIHSFCERLLQRFPLEAGVPPGFEIMDDATGREVIRQAINQTLLQATSGGEAGLADALALVVTQVQGDSFDEVLAAALGQRQWLRDLLQLDHDTDDPFVAAGEIYREGLGLARSATVAGLEQQAVQLVDPAMLGRAVAALRDGGKLDGELADKLARAAPPGTVAARLGALADALLTATGTPRADSRFGSKKVREAEPAVAQALCDARDRLHPLLASRDLVRAIDLTVALARLASSALQHYQVVKSNRAALDFDDLIERTAGLLSSPESAEWVLFKLDGGIDHILVDEAQDTSPTQWGVIKALATEFLGDAGAGERGRSVFAVGDEKQSIYSFQGAAPEMFQSTGLAFRALAEQAGKTWRAVPLTLSFRTVEPVLAAVDRVFRTGNPTARLGAGIGDVRHEALRLGEAGLVEVWPVEEVSTPAETDAFDPLDEQPVESPVARLSARIADTVGQWIAKGERLASEDRPMTAGDILILVARRRPFAPAMVAALKARGIPVAGADRIRLTEQLAVADLMALGRVLVLPEDDLSLACVLKSPLFDLDDDDLMSFATGKRGALFKALLAAAKSNPRLAPAAAMLKTWRGLADFLPPYELLVRVLDRDGMRPKMLARLGPEAADAIDELLARAIAYDDQSTPSLQGFLASLETGDHEIKRDMEPERGEVRVMTVHGAKGLEAPVVILADTCGDPINRRGRRLIALPDMARPVDQLPWQLWMVAGAGRSPRVGDAIDQLDVADRAERNRLLYVAMTRARDRLYVAGFGNNRRRPDDCWYETVINGLGASLVDAVDVAGQPVRRLESVQQVPARRRRAVAERISETQQMPPWATTRPPQETRLAVPLAPSRLVPAETDDDGEPAALPPLSTPTVASPGPSGLAGDRRFLRGLLTHALLEHLPALDPSIWPKAAAAFVSARGADLNRSMQRSIVQETLAVLHDPVFAPVFGRNGRAEVAIAAEISDPAGRRPPLSISGQIDRLVHTEQGILIVDFKTNRPPPSDATGVPPEHLLQLAAYRLAIKKIFQVDEVHAALLWTFGARLMPVPSDTLDHVETQLWERMARRLDAAIPHS